MRALIVGGTGQLGRCLVAAAPHDAEVVEHGSATLDITDRASVDAEVTRCRPDIIFNAAAYTAVDDAEDNAAAALALNGTAVGHLACAADRIGARLVHVSTDFVFDGSARSPYRPDARPSPLSVYGRTKLAGERAAGEDALIVRTAWVYAQGSRNFVTTMLRLMSERPEVRVVKDQTGSPTYAPNLASALWAMAQAGLRGLHHFTDSGACSWFDFASTIQREAIAAGLLRDAVPVIPVETRDYPTRARRPHYSVLDTQTAVDALGAPPPHWRANLRTMIKEVVAHG